MRASLWLIPYTVGVIAGSLLSPILARRIRPGYVIGAGLAIATIGFLLLTGVQAAAGLPVAVAGLVIVFFGIAPTWVLGTDLIVGSAPPEKAGSASSLSETAGELGVALGVAVLGSVGTAVYRSRMADAVPADVPAGAAEATRDTLVGATAAAAQLPDQLGAALLDTAREAFTIGFNVAAAISVPASVLLAALAVVLLRHVRPSGETVEAEDIIDEADPPITSSPTTPFSTVKERTDG